MRKEEKTRILRGILLILIALILLFIWTNSMQAASVSDGVSSGLLEQINRVLGIFGITGMSSDGLLRKLAHGFEFMVLGICILTAARSFGQKQLIPVLFAGVMTGLCDETIQMGSPGRSSEVRDVWIDFGGFAVGCVVVLLVEAYLRRRKRRGSDPESDDKTEGK